MDATQLGQFNLNARPSPYPASGVTIPSINLLPSFFSLTSSSTPKMDRVRKSIDSVGVTTYLGSLNFLDSLSSFDSIFGNTPVMLCVTRRAAGSCVTEGTKYLTTRINTYCDLCQLHLLCSIVKLQFVGTKNYDTHRMMHDIYLALSSWNLYTSLMGNLLHSHRTHYTNNLLTYHPSFSPMRPLGLLVLLSYFITHWELNYRMPFGLQDISCQIIQPCQPSHLKHLLYKSCGKICCCAQITVWRKVAGYLYSTLCFTS